MFYITHVMSYFMGLATITTFRKESFF